MGTIVPVIRSGHSTQYYRVTALPALIPVLVSGLSMLVLLPREDTYDG